MPESTLEALIPKKFLGRNTFSAVNESTDFSAHSHDYFEIVLTLESNFIHTVNGKSSRPKTGDTFILRPSDVHSARPIDDTQPHILRDIYVSCALMEDACNSLSPFLYAQLLALPANRPLQFHLSPSQLSHLNSLLKYPFFINDNAVNDSERLEMVKKAVVTEVLGTYIYEDLVSENKMPECLTKLLDALQSRRFAQLKIEDMATELGYSHTYLCKRFSAYFGKTIERYLIDRRIDESVPLLLQTDLPVYKIANSLGWEKASNYSIAFRQLYGVSPQVYRANVHENAE